MGHLFPQPNEPVPQQTPAANTPYSLLMVTPQQVAQLAALGYTLPGFSSSGPPMPVPAPASSPTANSLLYSRLGSATIKSPITSSMSNGQKQNTNIQLGSGPQPASNGYSQGQIASSVSTRPVPSITQLSPSPSLSPYSTKPPSSRNGPSVDAIAKRSSAPEIQTKSSSNLSSLSIAQQPIQAQYFNLVLSGVPPQQAYALLQHYMEQPNRQQPQPTPQPTPSQQQQQQPMPAQQRQAQWSHWANGVAASPNTTHMIGVPLSASNSNIRPKLQGPSCSRSEPCEEKKAHDGGNETRAAATSNGNAHFAIKSNGAHQSNNEKQSKASASTSSYSLSSRPLMPLPKPSSSGSSSSSFCGKYVLPPLPPSTSNGGRQVTVSSSPTLAIGWRLDNRYKPTL